MILFLYGADTYRRNMKMRELYAAYQKKNINTDVLSLDLEETPKDWEKVRDFLNQPSMFEGKKMVVVRECGVLGSALSPKEEKEWAHILEKQGVSKNSFVIAVQYGAPKKIFSFLLRDPVQAQEFPELEGATLRTFLHRELLKRNLVCAKDAEEYLVRVAHAQKSERSWYMTRWLDVLQCAGFRSPLARSDIARIVRDVTHEEVFARAKQIMYARNREARLITLETAFLEGADAGHLFNSLAILARGEDAVRLADYDVSIKSGGLEYEEALTEFCMGK